MARVSVVEAAWETPDGDRDTALCLVYDGGHDAGGAGHLSTHQHLLHVPRMLLPGKVAGAGAGAAGAGHLNTHQHLLHVPRMLLSGHLIIRHVNITITIICWRHAFQSGWPLLVVVVW